MSKPIDNKDNQKMWSAYQLALNLGFMIVIPIILFGVGGVLLDKYLDSFPIFVFIGFVLAMTSGLTVVYVKTKDLVVQGLPQPPKQPKQDKK
ncbi:AtpZ/AtpI family protein [Candidatus Peregrinibacteria bacterium]|jgi:F0F1-type ATP synthase assembly protein I|nr:AtpZ/AtpI family protein [Candidatus Peregrinibacteria bacterium]MBT4055517.1 AtpZ/AtpI family protein [Candidatus Peregrinibacteria bacterium]